MLHSAILLFIRAWIVPEKSVLTWRCRRLGLGLGLGAIRRARVQQHQRCSLPAGDPAVRIRLSYAVSLE